MTPAENKSSGQIDVRYVAHLARMHLADDEVARLQPQLEQIVGYVHQLNELNVEGIEPTAHAAYTTAVVKYARNQQQFHNAGINSNLMLPPIYKLREDEVRECLDHDVVMKNAPLAREGQFIVPKIIE